MKNILLVLTLILAFFLPISAQTTPKLSKDALTASNNITKEQLSDYLHFVASDEMEGRDTPSRGLDATAKFIGTMLSRWGFKPAGDNNTFYQKIMIRSESVDSAKAVLEINGQKFNYADDYFRMAGNGMAQAPLVFANSGWFIKEKGIDSLAGIDVKGKILVLYTGGFPMPNTVTPQPVRGKLQGEKGKDWLDPISYAKEKGAVGIILVASPPLQNVWERVQEFFARGNKYPEKLMETPKDLFPIVLASQKVGEAIFAGTNSAPWNTQENIKAAPLELNKTANVNLSIKSESVPTQNVVALWEGSDPILKKEMVAVGAHYDHVGMNPDLKGEDKIYNGADDDGSGTVAVLAMAEALAKASKRPKRSILLVWHAGEEKGLWGSDYFNKFPTVDIKNVVTQLNIDMIGRSKKPNDSNPQNKELSGENGIYVIGSNMMSSTLGQVTSEVNKTFLKLDYDFRYDDPNDKNRFFFRSDHFNYALNGIPVVFWFDGVHEDYHQVGDHADKIDYVKLEKVTKTIFMTMWTIGDLKERPKVDKELPPELRQR